MFIVGALFSWVTFPQVHQSGTIFKNKYFATCLIFQTLFCMPLSIYCYIVYPDWCWMYWLDSKTIPFYFVILAFSFYYVFSISGFSLGFFLGEKEPSNSIRLLRASFFLLLIFIIFTFRRLFYIGTVSEFQNNALIPLMNITSLFLIVSGGILIALFVLITVLYYFGRELDLKWNEGDQNKLDKKMKVVSLYKVTGGIKEGIKNSLNNWDGINYIKNLLEERQNKVIIKPNFCGGGKDKIGTQTSPEVLSATIDILREINSNVQIKIVESGSIYWWNLTPLLKGSIYERLFNEKNVEFVNLSTQDTVKHNFGGRMGIEEIAKILLEPHLFIDIPVAKTHAFYKMSGALKNLLGLTPYPHKLLRYHGKGFADYFGRIFIDIYRNFTPDLIIVDGITSAEAHGPAGTPKETNFIITSPDAICADLVLAEIMHYKKEEIPYLKILFKDGMRCDYKIVGDKIEEIKPKYWKHTNVPVGLTVNILRLIFDHIKVNFKG